MDFKFQNSPFNQRGKINLDSRDVERNRSQWEEISRTEALRLFRNVPVVVGSHSGGPFNARWFDSSSQFYAANGPYNYKALRYYKFIGNLQAKVSRSSGGSAPRRPEPVDLAEAGEVDSMQNEKAKDKEKLSLFDAVWIGASDPHDKSKEPKTITSAMLMASISCKVSSEGLMPGDSISFNIMRADTSEKIETVIGRMESNPDGDFAVAKWQVRGKALEDALGKGSVELLFVAKHFGKKLECKSGKLVVCDGITIHHHFDIHEEGSQNDLATLETTDGSWKHTLEVAQMKELKPHWVAMVFPGAPKGKMFNLIKDTKDGEEPYYMFKNLGYDVIVKEGHLEDV